MAKRRSTTASTSATPMIRVKAVHTSPLARRGDELTVHHTDAVEGYLANGVLELLETVPEEYTDPEETTPTEETNGGDPGQD